MARTYAKITNVEEIYLNGIERYYLVQIPKSKYHAVSRYNEKQDNWTLWVMDLMGKKKYLIEKNAKKEVINACLSDIVLKAFDYNKRKPTLRIIRMRLNNLIK